MSFVTAIPVQNTTRQLYHSVVKVHFFYDSIDAERAHTLSLQTVELYILQNVSVFLSSLSRAPVLVATKSFSVRTWGSSLTLASYPFSSFALLLLANLLCSFYRTPTNSGEDLFSCCFLGLSLSLYCFVVLFFYFCLFSEFQ